jgi:hypothetical protein
MDEDAGRSLPPDRSDRVSLSAEVGSRRSGSNAFRVRAFDLSPSGKIEFIERPAIDERFWVKFDSIEAIEAGVWWVDGHIGGLEFARPLHDAVFRKLTGRHQSVAD